MLDAGYSILVFGGLSCFYWSGSEGSGLFCCEPVVDLGGEVAEINCAVTLRTKCNVSNIVIGSGLQPLVSEIRKLGYLIGNFPLAGENAPIEKVHNSIPIIGPNIPR